MGRVWLRHWRIATVAAVGMVGFGLLAVGPAGFAWGVREYTERAESQHQAAMPPVGSEVRDGAITFVVHKVRCGPAAPAEAVHGRLCEVTVRARNDGPHPVTVPGSIQRLAGPRGARHLPIPGEPEPFGTLEPGTAATARISYDLPEHATVTHVEVQASPATTGRAVALAGPPLPLLSAG